MALPERLSESANDNDADCASAGSASAMEPPIAKTASIWWTCMSSCSSSQTFSSQSFSGQIVLSPIVLRLIYDSLCQSKVYRFLNGQWTRRVIALARNLDL